MMLARANWWQCLKVCYVVIQHVYLLGHVWPFANGCADGKTCFGHQCVDPWVLLIFVP